jgi:hypothetical protein
MSIADRCRVAAAVLKSPSRLFRDQQLTGVPVAAPVSPGTVPSPSSHVLAPKSASSPGSQVLAPQPAAAPGSQVLVLAAQRPAVDAWPPSSGRAQPRPDPSAHTAAASFCAGDASAHEGEPTPRAHPADASSGTLQAEQSTAGVAGALTPAVRLSAARAEAAAAGSSQELGAPAVAADGADTEAGADTSLAMDRESGVAVAATSDTTSCVAASTDGSSSAQLLAAPRRPLRPFRCFPSPPADPAATRAAEALVSRSTAAAIAAQTLRLPSADEAVAGQPPVTGPEAPDGTPCAVALACAACSLDRAATASFTPRCLQAGLLRAHSASEACRR